MPRLDDPSVRDAQDGIALVHGPGASPGELRTLPLPPGEAPGPGQYVVHDTDLVHTPYLPDVLAHCQPPHLAALEDIIRQEQQAHEAYDGPAAIRHSANFHIQLQAISGNQVLTEMVTGLSQRSSLVIATWGAPWRQGCRCNDHEQLVDLLRQKALQPLSDALMHHFEHIVASLCFERAGECLPDFARLFAGHKES